MSRYNFNQIIDRKNTNSYKWDNVVYSNPKMLPMPVADMDFPVANEIVDTLDQITEHRVLGYANVPDSLKKEAQKKLLMEYGWKTALEWQVWIPGIVPGITATCKIFSSEFNGILTPIPIYHPFHLVAGWTQRKLLTFDMKLQNGRWTYDFDSLEIALRQGPARLLFCNPHNPGGTVFNSFEINRIVDLCEQYNCMIISDEIHADLRIHPVSKHICIGQIIPNQTPSISFFATSKTYNTAGIGGAFAIISDEKTRNKFINETVGIFPMLTRHSIEVMHTSLTMNSDWLTELLVYLRSNHDLLIDFVEKTKLLSMVKLEATYLAWIHFDAAILGDFQTKLFDNGLHVLRGEQFKGVDFIRLNFACPKEQMIRAISVLQKTMDENS